MTISEKIFKILDEEKMSQKDFSMKTGIPQSTISDWRKKNTNPASDKILIICEVLKVTPYELLSGVKEEGNRSNGVRCHVIAEGSEENMLLEMYDMLDRDSKNRLLGYLQALKEIG
ncbi:MAG: helix-turn-helix domain-containing protein [Agathobacter sp.]